MKRKYKVLIIVFSIILILFATFFTTDYIRAKKEKKPIFAVYVAGYDDGGSKKYLGLFYNVYCVKIYYSEPEWHNEDGTLKEEYQDQVRLTYWEVTPWFKSLDKVKEKYRKQLSW